MELTKNEKSNLAKSAMALFCVLTIFIAIKAVSDLKALKYVGTVAGQVNTMTFDGKGEVMAIPDIANISFSVTEEGKTQKEAQDKVSTKTKSAIDSLKQAGIAEKDIKTENYNAYPKYDYGPQCISYPCPQRQPKIIGFEISQTITAKVRNTDDTGKILDLLATVNAQNLNGPNFEVDDIEKVQAEARLKAITDAKSKAEILAKDLGVSLVRIVNFYENSGGGSPIYYSKAMMSDVGGAESAPAPTIPTGENKITSNVTITYEIK